MLKYTMTSDTMTAQAHTKAIAIQWARLRVNAGQCVVITNNTTGETLTMGKPVASVNTVVAAMNQIDHRAAIGALVGIKDIQTATGMDDTTLADVILSAGQSGVLSIHCSDWMTADRNHGNLLLSSGRYCVGVAIRQS